MEQLRDAGGVAESQEKRGGVRYITEELLLRLTGCRSLAVIHSLNLSSATGDKCIKFIENLHGCQRLQVLNLNHNMIERMERLNALTQLRDLQLAHNNIQRIEGLENLSSLQHLNLSYNRIEHIPVWLGKKLHSLHTLHLQHNLITSLYEVSRLRCLSSLSELSVSGNPASSLPHSRLLLLYHLRTLHRLDDLPITQEEREHAHRRFSVEELKRLQQEVDSSQSELSRLQEKHQATVTRLHQLEETNQTLTAQTQTQRHSHTLLEQELHTKSQLLEKTTAELTRAFHKLYELEQELAFYKIDTKLSPLPPGSIQDVSVEDSVAESPYIGKARHIRKNVTSTPQNYSSSSPSFLQIQEGSGVHTDVKLLHSVLEDYRTQQSTVEAEPLQLTHEIEKDLEAEHTSPKDIKTHKWEVRCQLLTKLSVLENLRFKVDDARKQMERQTEESRKTERETEELETQLLTLDTTDQQHAHATTQLSSCRQMLDRMSCKQSELEGRLDDMLSRIAMETQEIKELEQQLTDGQILANEALQRDLEEIISGLQEYLRALRDQARCAQQQIHSLQAENLSLQLHLEDTQRHCRQLEDTTRMHIQSMAVQEEEELSVLRMEAEALRGKQVESNRQQVELEAELQQLRAELTRQVTVGELQLDALQAAVDKEKQKREIRESQLQLAIDTLQDEKSSLQQIVQKLQTQLDQTKAQLHQTRTQYKETRAHIDQTRIQLDQFTADLLDLQEVLSGPEELDEDKQSPVSPELLLSRSVEQLYRTIQQTRTSREQLEQDHNQEQIARLRAELAHNQDHIGHLEDQVAQGQDHIAQFEAWVAKDRGARDGEQDQESYWWLKEELERLRGKLQKTKNIQQNLETQLEQSRLQLQDVQQERDKLLQQLRSQSDGHQRSLGRLNRKLQQLSRFMCDSDQLTSEQLKSTVEQLRALNHTVELLHTQKSVDELDGISHQAEHTHDLQDEHTVEKLRMQQAEAQRQQVDQVRTRNRTRTGISARDRGQRCFIPPGQSATSFGSQGTQDSGLGLQYLSSPDRGRQQEKPPTGGGYWVYVPLTHTDSDTAAAAGWRDSGGGSDADRSSRGGTPPPVPAEGVSAGLSDSYTPLVGPTWLLCGSPSAVVYSHPAGGAVLHCNIPEHRDMVEKCVCEHREAEKQEQGKKKLRLETKRLRHTLRRHRSVMEMCDEVECVEKTLLKRRAELRQADRLLLEAQSCIHTTRDKASAAQWTADVLQLRVQDNATCLQENLQVEDLRRMRQQEEQTLREVQEVLRSRDQEFQQLGTKIHSAADRLSDLLSDCQEAQKRLNSVNSQVEQQEQRLVQRSEEHQAALKRVEDLREEEQRLQNTVKELLEQQEELLCERRSAVSAVTEEEQKVFTLQSELSTHRAELKLVLQELLVEQQLLEEVKTKRTQTVQRLHKKKDELDRTKDELDMTVDDLKGKQDKLDRMRDQLDSIQDEVEKRKDELEKKQQDVERKMDDLDKMQNKVDKKRDEMTELLQQVESHRKEAESCLKTINQQRTELQELQEELSRRREERSSLQEQCKHLEARRRHADRCLSAVEVELAKQREEHNHAQLLQQETVRDAAATQEQLNESSELLSLLAERVEERRKQLQTVEQELSASRQQQQQQREEELKELDRQMELKQAACVGFEDVTAAVHQLEDRRRRLTEQQLQLNQLSEELLHKEEELKQQREGQHVKEEELKRHKEGLRMKEEGLIQLEEELQQKREKLRLKLDELHEKEEESREVSEEEEDESFYLSTAGLRTACSPEEERWKVELQREELKQQEDRLKARLRCSLWNQQENLEVRRLETEESLLGLKLRLDQLDSLLTH
ncbi:centriolin isoform X2 [Anabas testudineus]|uniref:Centriolin n=1 Tax=Anabas testudineus TaxID=64144 RepID=A0AAQ6IQI6_ANATE|nr:centriolin isoform X2 [Anabas testudineus]